MNSPITLARLLATLGGATVAVVCTASTALAQAGLPRTYQPQRIDSPGVRRQRRVRPAAWLAGVT